MIEEFPLTGKDLHFQFQFTRTKLCRILIVRCVGLYKTALLILIGGRVAAPFGSRVE